MSIYNATGFPWLDVSLSYTFGPGCILCTLGYAKDMRRGLQNGQERSAPTGYSLRCGV